MATASNTVPHPHNQGIKVSNNTKKSVYVSPDNFQFVGNGQVSQLSSETFGERQPFPAVTLGPGQSASGELTFYAPKASKYSLELLDNYSSAVLTSAAVSYKTLLNDSYK